MRAKGNINLSKKDTIRTRLTNNGKIRQPNPWVQETLFGLLHKKTNTSCKLSFIPVT